jgi:hypothetical protein
MNEVLPPLPEGTRLMSCTEAIVIMQNFFRVVGCPIKINQNMTMGGVLQLMEHWTKNVEERQRVIAEARTVGALRPAAPAEGEPVIQTGFARIK